MRRVKVLMNNHYIPSFGLFHHFSDANSVSCFKQCFSTYGSWKISTGSWNFLQKIQNIILMGQLKKKIKNFKTRERNVYICLIDTGGQFLDGDSQSESSPSPTSPDMEEIRRRRLLRFSWQKAKQKPERKARNNAECDNNDDLKRVLKQGKKRSKNES